MNEFEVLYGTCIKVNIVEENFPDTKRGVVSSLCSFFDPFGISKRCLLSVKLLIQKLWIRKISWMILFLQIQKIFWIIRSDIRQSIDNIPKQLITTLNLHSKRNIVTNSKTKNKISSNRKSSKNKESVIVADSIIKDIKGWKIPN